MQLAASVRPLRHRSFALLWSSGLVSHIGSWLQTVAVGALVVEATGQAMWAALVAAAQFLPIGALSPVGGALADRLERRPFLLAGSVALSALAFALAGFSAAGHATPVVVVGVVFLSGCVQALVFPFQQAILPELVPREDLMGAVSLGSAEYNLGRVVGPALAGIVVTVGSFTWAFALNAVSFLAVTVALLFMHFGHPPERTGESLRASIRAGARAARSEPGCRIAIGLIAAAALLVSPFIALVPAVADRLVGGDEAELARATGMLTTAQGVGAVVGALLLAPSAARVGHQRAIVAALIGTPTAVIAYSAAPTLPWAVAAITVLGVAYIWILSGLGTVVQLRAPDEFRGRIVSLFFLALGVIYPLGAIAQGALADRVGLSETSIGGAVVLLAVVAALALRRPQALAALGDPGRGVETVAPAVAVG